MDHKQELGPDLAEAMRLAQSPAGKQLLSMLRQQDSGTLQAALEQAKNGNFDQARQAINAFLSTPEAKSLMERLEDGK